MARPMNGIPTSTKRSEPPIENSVLSTLTEAIDTNSPSQTATTARQVLSANGDHAKERTASSAPFPARGMPGVLSAVIGATLPFVILSWGRGMPTMLDVEAASAQPGSGRLGGGGSPTHPHGSSGPGRVAWGMIGT